MSALLFAIPSLTFSDCLYFQIIDGQSCYAFTTCNDPEPTLPPTSLGGSLGSSEANGLSDTLSGSATDSAATTDDEADTMPGCTGKPCEVAGECRSQYGFCGGSFIYCNEFSSWTIENCGLFGVNANGDTLLCDADLFDCPDGKKVIRNPDQACEFFACPDDKDSVSSGGFSAAFQQPASSPTLPALPMPTLPHIENPKMLNLEDTLQAVSKPSSGGSIDLSLSKPHKESNNVVIIGGKQDEVADDKEDTVQSTPSQSSQPAAEAKPVDAQNLNAFNKFSAEEWFNSGYSNKAKIQVLASFVMAVLTVVV